MTADEAVVAVLDALEAAAIPYMIVGSLASNFHGIPRSTRDADFVIDAVPGGLQRLGDALPASLNLDCQGSFEPVTGTTRYVIDLVGNPFVCGLFVRTDDPHDQERFRRRLRVRVLDRAAFVATAEDMIVTKLRWADAAQRLKDREDIRNILAVRGPELDWAYLRRWSSEHGTLGLLEEIRSSVPPA
ncbi:MAG TPA: hypothetical protein VIX63_07400 [Vicinamibacterales bacterium]